MDIRSACEQLALISRLAEEGRLNAEDLEQAEEAWRYIKDYGQIFCDNLRDRYVKIGVRVQVDTPVAVKDDDGSVVIRPFIGLQSKKFLTPEDKN